MKTNTFKRYIERYLLQFTIKKTASLWLMLFLTPMLMAQQADWQWAKRGGSGTSSLNGTPIREEIDDMAVDKEGNIYIVSRVGGGPGMQGPTLSGVAAPLNFYGERNGSLALLLASYDCQGNYRWSKLVSGYSSSAVPRVGVDTLGHVYFSGTLPPSEKTWWTNTEHLTHFDTDSIFPYSDKENEYKRNLFLARYDTSGNFQQLIMPQPEDMIRGHHTTIHSKDLMVDPDGTQHLFLWVGKQVGHPLGDRYPIIEGDTLADGFHDIRYNAQGVHLGTVSFEIEHQGDRHPYHQTRMTHDPVNKVYYLVGGNDTYNDPTRDLIIGGQIVQSQMFIAKFDEHGNNIWLREAEPELRYGLFCPIRPRIDTAGNIYLAARMNQGEHNSVNFLTYTAQNPHGSTFPVLFKMNPEGNVIWGTNGSTTAATPNWAAAINGEEVVIAGSYGGIEWGSIAYPSQYKGYDVFLARFNKQDGNIISMDTLSSNFGSNNYVNDLVTDRRANAYVGGEFSSRLFVANDTLDKPGGSATNFFVAKYGNSNCNCDLPEAKFEYKVTQAGTVQFTYTGSSNFDRLEWSYGNGQEESLSTATATHTYTDAGEYWVCVTAYDDSCGRDTWCTLVDPFYMGTPNLLDKKAFSYYPNPVKEGFTLESLEALSYTLYDLTGKQLKKGKIDIGSKWIPMENLESGIYLLRLSNAKNEHATVKLIKE